MIRSAIMLSKSDMWFRFLVLAAVVGLTSLALSAQTGTAQLTGVLTDPSKALVADAQVTLTNVGRLKMAQSVCRLNVESTTFEAVVSVN
jgi:hypothetical protein